MISNRQTTYSSQWLIKERVMDICETCAEMGIENCKYCSLGNPCLGCEDYDIENDTCKSNGGCGGDAE